jgi:thioredoxin reductase (NADPH)
MSQLQHVKVLIIGAGPAGLTAALYAARSELKPLVMEGWKAPGGQLMITTDVENYPGFPDGIMGPEIIDLFRKQAERFGTTFRQEMVTHVDVSERPFRCVVDEDPEDIITADTIIIASGADAKWLGLDDEKRLQNYGVSACATCDGAFFKGVEIGLVGGGDTAMEEALFLTRYGTKIHVVVRRDELRASKIMAARALAHAKIEFHWNQEVTAIGGSPETGVTSVTTRNRVTGEMTDYPWNALFIAIGHTPNAQLWKGILDMDDLGYLVTRPGSTYTNVEGIFASGDVADHVYRQAVTAAGTGCAAAIDAERWLETQGG